jgi:phosphatidylethanolamine/phosphatidyl-N-methylethanolamine N-methyltransferase
MTNHSGATPPASGQVSGGGSAGSTIRLRGAFLREFLRDPKATAAIAPSSRHLGRQMVAGLELSRVRSIVEYGPGTGTFTRCTLDALPAGWFDGPGPGTEHECRPGNQFIAIEYNAELSRLVQAELPSVQVVNDSAENVVRICTDRGIHRGELDLVISGLGWVSLDKGLITRMLEATRDMLRPGGEFRTFGYHVGLMYPGAWHFRRELKRLFSSTSTSRIVWRNVPPAFVYRGVR